METFDRVANALEALGLKKGDAIAIDMPMNVHAVTTYLAIILARCVAVTIPGDYVLIVHLIPHHELSWWEV